MESFHLAKYTAFDHRYLQGHPETLDQLAVLYCKIWEMDEAFGEYHICPQCQKKYYSYQQVEVAGIKRCLICGSLLEPAWKPEEVKAEILNQASQSLFFGILVHIDDTVQGFTWLVPITFWEIEKKWGQEVSSKVRQLNPECQKVIYYDELGVAEQYRCKGIGRMLIYKACNWCATNFPNSIGLLRTHQRSRALPLYETAGYKILCEDTQYGDERVLLAIPRLANLTHENLL